MAGLEERITEATGDKDETTTEMAQDNGQTDGSTTFAGGSQMAEPADYEVEVKLIDETSPLYSVKSFEELGL